MLKHYNPIHPPFIMQLFSLPSARNGGSGRASLLNSVGVVGVSLPGNSAILSDIDELVLESFTSVEADRALPHGVLGGVVVGIQRNSVVGVPVAKGLNATDNLDGLAVLGLNLLVESDINSSSSAALSGGGSWTNPGASRGWLGGGNAALGSLVGRKLGVGCLLILARSGLGSRALVGDGVGALGDP